MAEEEQEKVKDVAMVQEFLSAYLYGLYTLKSGRLAPSKAIEYVMSFASLAEKASAFGKSCMGSMKG
ncbi:MAG TPA: hypothetical protein EYQ20_03805 [candidate division Zixibacteria bacterium]|jgi:hypothetical protein|nr:hypothetical protein [Candidatus Latescibacterota bacterium]MDP7237299.1 hypothetical protein [Candidatus Latescibacterota bacterium]HIG45575.1 hypothetical protein [candidate division Zixibacteria bacterium]|tara:strand:+ start:153 stop:353 length:201 start_codon:yes stop_codon:yes gene_type:complete